MKTGLIITGGTIDYGFAGGFLENRTFDTVIAVDGGLEAMERLKLEPDVVVGDFDTVRPEVLEQYRAKKGIAWEQHKPEKDETDTELALNTAMELGCSDLVVLGATGGRMDHAIGNIHLLYACLLKGVHACMVDEKNRISILNGKTVFHADHVWGKYISFLPLTENVRKITLEGFKYPLFEKDITIGTSLCISNELASETGVITFSDGILICVESHD